MVSWSPSATSASSPPEKRTSSSLTYTLTKRCSLSSLINRSFSPELRLSMSSITSSTFLPDASTDFSPPVCCRRMVGMDTVTAMSYLRIGFLLQADAAGRGTIPAPSHRQRDRGHHHYRCWRTCTTPQETVGPCHAPA